jgi:hypothetical protein
MEQKENKSYRQFYRQLTLPAVTISDLQRREAPLSTCNHFLCRLKGKGWRRVTHATAEMQWRSPLAEVSVPFTISAPSWAGSVCTRNGRVPKGISTIFTIAFATSNTSASGAAVNSNPFMISLARLAVGRDSYSFNRARCLNLHP